MMHKLLLLLNIGSGNFLMMCEFTMLQIQSLFSPLHRIFYHHIGFFLSVVVHIMMAMMLNFCESVGRVVKTKRKNRSLTKKEFSPPSSFSCSYFEKKKFSIFRASIKFCHVAKKACLPSVLSCLFVFLLCLVISIALHSLHFVAVRMFL